MSSSNSNHNSNSASSSSTVSPAPAPDLVVPRAADDADDKTGADDDTLAGGLLKGISLGLFVLYIFCSPLFILDELRRTPPSLEIALFFFPVLILVKYMYAVMHFFFKVDSLPATNLLLTLILLSAYVLHSDLSDDLTFRDLYLPDLDADADNADSSTTTTTAAHSSSLLSKSFLSELPFLPRSERAIGMPAAVAELHINSVNLVCYHWLMLIGIASAIAMHQTSFPLLQRKGRLGIGLFFVLYGFAVVSVNEIQRVWISFFVDRMRIFSAEALMLAQQEYQQPLPQNNNNQGSVGDNGDGDGDGHGGGQYFQQVLMFIAFVNIFCGICCIFRRALKLSSILMLFMIMPFVFYEVSILHESQTNIAIKKSNLDITPEKMEAFDVHEFIKYHTKYVYPLQYQCSRVLNLAMIFSGILFDMLRVYDEDKDSKKDKQIMKHIQSKLEHHIVHNAR